MKNTLFNICKMKPARLLHLPKASIWTGGFAKCCLIFLFLTTYPLSLFAQHWAAAGLGMKAEASGGVYTMAPYNGYLYAAGWFYQAGYDSAINIAKYDGASWQPVGSGITGGLSNVYCLCVYNGKLFAGGSFYAANDSATNDIAVWNGYYWGTAGTGMTTCSKPNSWVNAMAVYNGKLYAGGLFCKAGGAIAQNIAVWDGFKWDSLSSGINGQVNALWVYSGNLYAGGVFDTAGKVFCSNVAMWNGTVWAPVATGIVGTNVLAMAVYKGSLYAGGTFDTADGIYASNIAQWNGIKWDSVNPKGISGVVGTLCTFNNILYAAGSFTKAGKIATNNIAQWNGTSWDSVGKGTNNLINALTVYDSTLFAGGEFSRAGYSDVADVAEWGITAGIDEISTNSNEVNVYPNPSSGLFTIAFSHPELVSGSSQAIVEIYNVLGEDVYDGMLKQVQHDYTLDLTGKPSGIYLCRLISETGCLIGQRKLVIEK